MNSCIHSDSNTGSGGDTVWYNYTLASAGTIVDENTTSANPASNIVTATESICPKGWTLPSKTQIDSQRSISNFSPILGGNYANGTLYNENTRGYWWGAESYSDATSRYSIVYTGSNLSTDHAGRRTGTYIRCVSEEKTVTDLTYMQDMTPSIAHSWSSTGRRLKKSQTSLRFLFVSYRGGAYEIQTHDLYYAIVAL